jgi:hypothetical protein
MEILFRNFNAKVGKEDNSKPTSEIESLQKITNDNGVKSSKFCHI